MNLQLLKDGSGRLGLQLTSDSHAELKPLGSFTLADRDNAKLQFVFNDKGTDPDVKAGDGRYTGKVPVDFDLLSKINAEVTKFREPAINRYDFQSGNLLETRKLPATPIDLTSLRAGKTIELFPVTSLGVLTSTGAAFSGPVIPERSLLIRDLAVVEDAARARNPCAAPVAGETPGAWSFAHVMTELAVASGLSPAAFTEAWLNHFATAQEIRDSSGSVTLDAVSGVSAANLQSQVIGPWRARSGGGLLNLNLAPFRLLAIGYRPDLADGQYGSANEERHGAGEVHLVFGLLSVVDQNGDGDALDPGETCSAADMSVAFEYRPPPVSCSGIKSYANQWATLTNLTPGSAAYNTQLAALTEGVVTAGSGGPGLTALLRVRTNEQALTGVFQLREFQLGGDSRLKQVTLRNNPRQHQSTSTVVPILTPTPYSLNGSNLLRDEMLAHLGTINCTGYVFPEFVQGQPFLSGGADYALGSYWDHPDLTTVQQKTGRFKVSLNTCSGCHSGETATNFFHIRPSSPGTTAALSPFLFNSPYVVLDPRGVYRSFNEMDRRKQALTNLANRCCPTQPKPPLAFDFEWSVLANSH
jgi:hypothetical protein